jgi:hypothetical protein
MYCYGEFAQAVEKAGFDIVEARHNLGSNDYSLLRCRKANGAVNSGRK